MLKRLKKALAMLLCLALVAGLFPGVALAESDGESKGVITPVEEPTGAEIPDSPESDTEALLEEPVADGTQDTTASGECGDSLIWTLSSTGILTIAGAGDMWDFSTIETESSAVTTAPWFDRREEIKTVRILQGVTSIGNVAFMHCSNMTDITIPEGVTCIGDSAFSNCHGLTSVTIPAGAISIGSHAFYYCSNLSSITILEGVTLIETQAFDYCNSLTSLSIPASLSGVEGLSIDYCRSLKDIYYGGTKAAWRQLSVGYERYSITVHCSDGDIAAADPSSCGDNLIWTLTSEGVLTIAGTGDMWDFSYSHRPPWYSRNSEIKSVNLFSGVTSIGNVAFAGCRSMTNVTIPDGVTRIGTNAFDNCSGLTAVSIPEGVTSIGKETFSSCSALTSVTLPESLTVISDYAFYQCWNLPEITIPAGVRSIGGNAFAFCRSLTAITIPAGVTSIGTHGFAFCSGLTEVTIPEGVTTIDETAFYSCTALTRASLPASLVDWNPAGVFESCSSLAEIQVAEANPAYCAVDNIVYDKAMETLFLCPAGKTGSVTIPASVTTIGDNAFRKCSALTEIRFEGAAPSFERGEWESSYCFSGVTATAYYPRQESSWTAAVRQSYGGTITWVAYGPIASGQCGDDLTWTLEENGTLTISGTGDMWNWSNIDLAPWWSYCQYEITALDIQPGVTGIGEYAFHSCGKLTEITVPEGVTRIGYAAFSSCNSLTSVTLPASLTETGNDLFRSCDSLTDIYFGGTRAMWSQLNMPYDHYSITVHCSDGDIAPADLMYCGDNLIWTLSSEGVLTVAGSGSMWNFDDGHAPWVASLDSIKSVRIISGATSIGSNAFARCDTLTSVTIPEGVTSIGRAAFYACYGLTGVTIPESVTRIGRSAFNGCYGLTSVTIPKNVTAIGEYAFGSCRTLTEIRFEGSAPSFGELCFSVVTATAYYPLGDPTWTEEVRRGYGGEITWVGYVSLEDGFYLLVGHGDDGWAVTNIDQTEKFEPNPSAQGEYLLETTLAAGDEIKVVRVENNAITGWWPDGPDTQYHVDEAHSGLVEIYFKTDYVDAWSAFGGYFYIGSALSASAQVYGSSISLKGNIGLNFYVIPSEALTADSEAYVMLNETRYPIAEASTRVVSGLTLYQFSFEVPAKNMNDTVTLRVYSGDGSQAALYRYSDGEDLSATGYQTSVQEYIQKTRATSTDEKLLALLDAMSDYGSMAQLQFNYNADTRVPVLADLSQVTVEDLASYDYTITPGKYTGVSFNSASLSLQSETVLRIYLKLDEGEIGDYTFKLGTKEVQPYQSGSYWIVEISNIAAKDLDRLYTVTVTSASGKVLTVKACALGYCYRVLASDRTSDTLKDTVRAIYLYNQAANAYFG